ncbi:hypothetical protein [Sorangium sp. So ce1000]|uniref:hypothetical protein n=1 Tax=Sorangium sp. So ce1000 TaxID=3133325 RepID=UPI003F5E4E0A
MAKQHGEAAGVPRAIQSQGEDEAKAYAVGEVAPAPLHPTVEMERVRIEDPRRVPPPREGARRGGGARNPEQRAPLADVGAPSVSMPEGLAVTKRQPIVIDSEILAEWHGGRGGGEGGGGTEGSEGAGRDAATEGDEASGRDAATGSEGTGREAPRLAEVAAARRTERRAGWQRAAWVLAMGVLLAIGVTVLRSVWGAGGGAGEEARGAGGAVQGDVAPPAETAGAAAENAGAPGASAARAAGAPAVETAGAPAAEATGAPAASALGPRGAPGGPAVASHESGPRGQAAPQPVAPRPSATGPAAQVRDAPASSRVTPEERGAESPSGPVPPDPDDTPNFD